MSLPRRLLRAHGLLWSVAVCPIAILLFASCRTWPGAFFAIGAFLLSIAPAVVWWTPGLRGFRRVALIPLGGWAVIAIGLFVNAPNGRSPVSARVQNRYSDGAWHYQRFALGALLPEIDQFLLGFKLVPRVDPLFTPKQTRLVADLTQTIYAELEADPDFHALGSAMPEAYDQVWGARFDHGHYFLYIPPHLDRQTPAPALVFLHGTGGNFKAYTWLREIPCRRRNEHLSERRPFPVLQPSRSASGATVHLAGATFLGALNGMRMAPI